MSGHGLWRAVSNKILCGIRGLSVIGRHKVATAVILVAVVLCCWYAYCLPEDLFPDTRWSTVVVDRNGELLGARIASDGQWRFPPACTAVNWNGFENEIEKSGDGRKDYSKEVWLQPGTGREKYVAALVCFEDKYFRWHLGVNPVSLVRAAWSNIKAGHVVSGGSTITMQVIRMSKGRERTVRQKFIEAILATRLELRCSKEEILELYSEHAPFGGNVVGLEAAAWRYCGHPSTELSWGEAATLAVLPNSPSGIHPGRNRDKLLAKRNRLLDKLLQRGIIDSSGYHLACAEPLLSAPKPLPSYASQLVDDLIPVGGYIRTGIDINIQRQVERIMDRHSSELAAEGIGDLAAVVLDIRSGGVLAWCGNASPDRKRPGVNVDIAKASRSSGSILKPFLYYAALRDGVILPHSLIVDTPLNINGFIPQNFNMDYDGAVPASEALCRSLNVPAVHLLKEFGVQKFLEELHDWGFTTLTRSASDYGLSLILGGGECRLDEVTAAYAALAREGMGIGENRGKDGSGRDVAAWYTLETLGDVNRPDGIDWHIIRSVRKIAWKTGTSWGYRDAWACGVDPAYAVGVWAGNASGVGAPGLLGASTAGPVMFDLFNILPDCPEWFEAPSSSDGVVAEVCSQSGFLAGPYCQDADTLLLPEGALGSRTCPYHIMENGKCFFRLPPAMEWFYRLKHPDYACRSGIGDGSATVYRNGRVMEFIYPKPGAHITLPVQLDGSPGEIVLSLAHHDHDATVYWHIDQEYVGETRFLHQMRVRPAPGEHTVTVVDDNAHTLSVRFNIFR